MNHPVKFRPIPKTRIWGGDHLKSTFGVTTAEAVGEYWVLSGHQSGMSVVSEGPFEGKTLEWLTTTYPSAYLGRSVQPRFPLLVKFLEAHTDLSVQIHPDDEYAKEHEGDFGKTEAWYVLSARPDGVVNYGHTFSNRDAFTEAVASGHVRDFLSYQSITPGALVYVPARTLHALLGGTIVLEIQQTSDVTYRVYDWDRVDEHGQSRELHVEQAADVLTYGQPTESVEPTVLFTRAHFCMKRLLMCAYFAIDEITCSEAVTVERGAIDSPDIFIVIEGMGELCYISDGVTSQIPVKPGDTVLVPTTLGEYSIAPRGEMKVIRTFYGSMQDDR